MTLHPHQSSGRGERAALVADFLIETHRQLSDLDPMAEYNDLLEHVARKARLARDTARLAATASRR